jgi:DNA modification methylase
MKRVRKMLKTYWYFKLFNSIKEEHEVDFAELELSSLFGNVERVRNFSDILYSTPFNHFTGVIRVQDMLAHELPYGQFQGFYAEKDSVIDVSILVRRLAYIREFFVAVPLDDPKGLLKQMFPSGEIDKNVQYFKSDGYSLIRFICNQYFLEKSQYISKVSRNENEVDRNVEALFTFLTTKLYRIPATATMQVGKRLEDYFTIREEPSLHLTHYMHPYKGRFHPKMVRALLNYIYPREKGLVMDNFAGCGTLLVEATWMELDSIGVEINPLSVLMSNVKCQSLSFAPEELKKAITSYLRELEEIFLSHQKISTGSMLLFPPKYDKDEIEKRKGSVPKSVLFMLKRPETIDKILIAHELAKKIGDEKIRNFILLGLSGTISDLVRRRRGEFLDVLRDRLHDLYLRVYIFHKLNQTLKIKLGLSKTYVEDARNMKIIRAESVDGIVTSPPYSTALDYIRNDYPQLILLELVDISWLEKNMIGNPNLKVYPTSLFDEMTDRNPEYVRLPTDAKEVILTLRKYGRTKEALRTYKFFIDMYKALEEMHRVMKHGSKCAIIIGNNHYKLDNDYVEVKNDEVLKQMALTMGFKEDRIITRELEKTRAGMIRYESILILEKL